MNEVFLVCPLGLEPLLGSEITALVLASPQSVLTESSLRQIKGGFLISNDPGSAEVPRSDFLLFCRVVSLSSRIATRALIRWGPRSHVYSLSDLEKAFGSGDLREFEKLGSLDKVKVSIRKSKLPYHFQKDIENFVSRNLRSPAPAKSGFEFFVDVYRDQLTFSYTLSSTPHYLLRGRPDVGSAPIRENIASALLLKALQLWGVQSLDGLHFLDPMAGSGALLTEALLFTKPLLPFPREGSPSLRELVFGQPFSSFFGVDRDPSQFDALSKNTLNFGVPIELADCRTASLPEGPIFLGSNIPYGIRRGEDLREVEDALLSILARSQVEKGFVLYHSKPEAFLRKVRVVSTLRFQNGGIPVAAAYFERE